MDFLDIEALNAAPLTREPFDYLILERFVRPEAQAAIAADYPAIGKAGSFALEDLDIKGAVADLIDEMNGPGFRAAISAKFGVDLEGRATTFTLRGMCGDKDGYIHTDSKTKIITILVYLNGDWAPDGGRLRLLRNDRDLEDYVAEAPPEFGSLVAFRRADNSWHGHKPFIGPRRVLQMNWVTSEGVANWQRLRHRLSAAVKRLSPARADGAAA
jgi:SM-20-related protein